MAVSVTTRSFDAARTGANTSETLLSPQSVRARGLRQARILQIEDDPRLEAQPLYLPGVSFAGATRDVVFQATMGNQVHAFDIETGAVLWSRTLGIPIRGSAAIDAHDINISWGILSTPVIDAGAGRLYLCYWTSADGTAGRGQHFAAVLDVATGAELHPPLSLEGASFDPGDGLPVQRFRSMERKQRAGLCLAGDVVLIPFGTIAETATSARGWIIAIDTTTWNIAATWCSTARGSGGGIWMSGAAPAIHTDGSIWVVTGNGDFDGVHDFGESVVRLRYAAAGSGRAASLAVTGWWSPWTDDARTATPDPDVAALLPRGPMPSNFRPVAHLARAGVMPSDMGSAWGDQDLGASGIVLLEELGIGLVSSKDGILYTVSLQTPGETTTADLTPATTPANYARLASPPILYTFFDPALSPAPARPTGLNTLSGNVTHHLHGTPLLWKSAQRGWMHFCGGENGNLRAWQIEADRSSSYLACSAAYASPAARGGGMPGWSLALSADGGNRGIVWGMIPYGDANMEITGSRLLAYDAEDFASFEGGGGEIVPIWDSQQWNWTMLHPKFNRPIIADGRVLVPTYGGQVLVLELA
nr:PQQ-binding-like beta-propeller repeat protein [uncultured Lichenicoccus sp.]